MCILSLPTSLLGCAAKACPVVSCPPMFLVCLQAAEYWQVGVLNSNSTSTVGQYSGQYYYTPSRAKGSLASAKDRALCSIAVLVLPAGLCP